MKLNTCSQVISLSKELENRSAKVYEDLARKFAEHKEVFLAFAKENSKNVVNTERTYYGVITDAIEGCFAFNIDPDVYSFEVSANAGLAGALDQVVAMEATIIKFYSEAAEQAKSLMADIPRAFTLIARKRGNRKEALMSLKK
ncbi:hypothetical protein ACFLXJ_00060 [Chloroflexota bacterium]